jgi:hypothetical protein
MYESVSPFHCMSFWHSVHFCTGTPLLFYKFTRQQVFFLLCLSIQDYVRDHNIQQTKKEKKNLNQTEDWTSGGCTDKHVSTN